MAKVSVIVPVYNTASYLPTCLDSLLAQTHTDLQILLINDGSSDSSPQICENYAQKDARIRYSSIPNGGVSVARNVGLSQVEGDFLTFVDSDDWLENTTIARYVQAMEDNQADVAFCNTMWEGPSGKSLRVKNPKKGVVNTDDLLKEALVSSDEKNRPSGYFLSIHNKCFRVKSLPRIVPFEPDVRILEDGLWLMAHLPHAKKGVLLPEGLYHRTVRQDSAIGDTQAFAEGYVRNYQRLLGVIETWRNPVALQYAVDSFYRYVRHLLLQDDKNHKGKQMQTILQWLKEPYQQRFYQQELRQWVHCQNSGSYKIAKRLDKMSGLHYAYVWITQGKRSRKGEDVHEAE